jgi:hypothetical protein
MSDYDYLLRMFTIAVSLCFMALFVVIFDLLAEEGALPEALELGLQVPLGMLMMLILAFATATFLRFPNGEKPTASGGRARLAAGLVVAAFVLLAAVSAPRAYFADMLFVGGVTGVIGAFPLITQTPEWRKVELALSSTGGA